MAFQKDWRELRQACKSSRLAQDLGNRSRKLKLDERSIDYCLKHKRSDVNEHYFVRYESEILELMQTVEDFFVAVAAEQVKAPQAQNFLDMLQLQRMKKIKEAVE